MSEKDAVNQGPESFIGSMKGTMTIVGDIVAPIDVQWKSATETDDVADKPPNVGAQSVAGYNRNQ